MPSAPPKPPIMSISTIWPMSHPGDRVTMYQPPSQVPMPMYTIAPILGKRSARSPRARGTSAGIRCTHVNSRFSTSDVWYQPSWNASLAPQKAQSAVTTVLSVTTVQPVTLRHRGG
jgi:hypothetical protein